VPLAEHARGLRPYAGTVVRGAHTAQRMREDTAGVIHHPSKRAIQERGWARILVHHTGNAARGIAPSFEGAFAADGVTHHVATLDSYLRTRGARDALPTPDADALDSGLVVWRDSDVMTAAEEAGEVADRSLTSRSTCEAHSLPFNHDPAANAILRKREPIPEPAWYDPFTLLGVAAANSSAAPSLAERDDVQTGEGGMTSNFVDSIGQTAGCPKGQRLVYTGVAADCTYTRRYGSVANATTQVCRYPTLSASVQVT
jgi:hypothetical protein